MNFTMTSKHKNPSNSRSHTGSDTDESKKLFDFDSTFEEQEKSHPGLSADAESTDDRTAELESTLTELKEKHLRLLAEFDNYKKRTSRERYELLNTASKDVILALLPVVDDFERALKVDADGQAVTSKEGIRLIYNRLLNVLQSQGLKAMESNGEAFDADLHDAITEVPAPRPDLVGKIIDTVEKGYSLNDKIIRHAKVVIGK